MLDVPQDVPVYRILTGSFYGPNDHLYVEDDVIAWEGEPNEEMEPLNALAKEAQKVFFKKLDDCAREHAERLGKPFTGRLKSLDAIVAQATSDARRIELVRGDGGLPLMGGVKADAPAIKKIVPGEARTIKNPAKAVVSRSKPKTITA